jgi:tetratricopeptide (TPR) repeat protein
MKKSRKPINQAVRQLDELLAGGDLESAHTLATTICDQLTCLPAPASSAWGVTVQPECVARTNCLLHHKAACRIAETYYKHAELELSKQWAECCDLTVNDLFTRRARVLLGHIAMAMDRDDEAIAHYTEVITRKNLYREQPAAYAGLLELLQITHQDDLVEQWVRHGQHKFRKAGGLQRRFLWSVSRVLRRRNHPLWREINQQIVELTPAGKKWRFKAQRELASDARKFGRYDEAEQRYSEICNQNLKSTRECVNTHLFLAECQAKQGKNPEASIQQLVAKSQNFRTQAQKDYATYRIAKFHEQQGNHEKAASEFWLLASDSSGKWSGAALTMLAKLAEKQGDLQRALDLYLQYPQRFPGRERLVLQAYAGGLTVASKLGDNGAVEQIATAIENRASNLTDYNTHLNLAFHYFKNREYGLARRFLERGIVLAEQTLAITAQPAERCEIHFHVLRRLADFQEFERAVAYFQANTDDVFAVATAGASAACACICVAAMALNAVGQQEEAKRYLEWLLQQIAGNPTLEPVIQETLGLVMMQSRDTHVAPVLFETVAEQYPAHPWVNIGRLRMAIDKCIIRDWVGALRLADEIIATCQPNAKMAWVYNTHWSGVYIRGHCLKALGDPTAGELLMREAVDHAPGMGVDRELR